MIDQKKRYALFSVAGRMALGAIFVWAGASKVLMPFAFLEEAIAYEIGTLTVVSIVTAMIPWLEIVLGIALLIGYGGSKMLVYAVALLLIFTALQVSAILRGLEVACGYFGGDDQQVSLVTVGRTLLLALIGTFTAWTARAPKHLVLPPGAPAALAIVVIFSGLSAVSVGAVVVDDNATEEYLNAGDALKDISAEEWTLIRSYAADPTRFADENTTRLIGKLSRGYRYAVRGANEGGYDFGVGPGTPFLLKHSPTHCGFLMPQLSAVLLANAKFASEQGNESRASQGLTAAYGLVNHLNQDVRFDSSTYAHQLLYRAGQTTEHLIDAGLLEGAPAQRVLDSLNRFDTVDPTNVREAFVEQVYKMREWYGDLVDRDAMAEASNYIGAEEDTLLQVTEGTLQTIDAELPQYLDKALAIIEEDDHARAKTMLQELKDETDGTVLATLFPSLVDPSMSRSDRWSAAKTFAKIKNAVTEQVADPGARNAAYDYLLAAKQWNTLTRDERSVLLDSSGDDLDITPEMIATQNACLALLETAAHRTYCDFSKVYFTGDRRFFDHGPVTIDVIMFDQLVVLRLNALTNRFDLSDESYTDIAELLTNMTHIGSERTWLSSQIVLAQFVERVLPLLDLAVAEASREQLAMIEEPIQKISPSDPFAIGEAVRFERKALVWDFSDREERLSDQEWRDAIRIRLGALSREEVIRLRLILRLGKERLAEFPAEGIDLVASLGFPEEMWVPHAEEEIETLLSEGTEPINADERLETAEVRTRLLTLRQTIRTRKDAMKSQATASTGPPGSEGDQD